MRSRGRSFINQAPVELEGAEAVGVLPPDPVVAGVLGVPVALAPDPEPAGAVAEAAGAAKGRDIWNCTGNGDTPTLSVDALAPAVELPPASLAEARVTAVTPSMRRSWTMVCATL